MLEQVSWRLADGFDQGRIKGVRALVAQHAFVESMIGRVEALDIIHTTPEPWAYMKHLRLTTLIWLSMLPLAMLPSLLHVTPALSIAIGYVVLKLDDLAIELQAPFGWDRSDIAVCLLNDKLQAELMSLLTAYARRGEVPPESVVQQEVVDNEADTTGLPGGG